MSERIALARQALRAAMQLRRSLSIPREAPVNAFDVAQMLGIDVRFLDTPSLEGTFVRDPGPRILLPSTKHRPKARIAFSCAHEIGHQQFDHGTKADRYWEDGQRQEGFDPVEFLVNAFAGHMLMPRAAVLDGFARRGWSAEKPTALQLFVVAGQIGVGYETLLTHLNVVLEILPDGDREELQKVSPKAIKSELVGTTWAGPLTIVDEAWKCVPIDLEVGEYFVAPRVVEARCGLITSCGDHGSRLLFTATKSGVADLKIGGETIVLRVARQHYVGPYSNRYLADPDEH
jgi:Zn-dependent peptidase ImmA (M78 family)